MASIKCMHLLKLMLKLMILLLTVVMCVRVCVWCVCVCIKTLQEPAAMSYGAV